MLPRSERVSQGVQAASEAVEQIGPRSEVAHCVQDCQRPRRVLDGTFGLTAVGVEGSDGANPPGANQRAFAVGFGNLQRPGAGVEGSVEVAQHPLAATERVVRRALSGKVPARLSNRQCPPTELQSSRQLAKDPATIASSLSTIPACSLSEGSIGKSPSNRSASSLSTSSLQMVGDAHEQLAGGEGVTGVLPILDGREHLGHVLIELLPSRRIGVGP